MHSVLTSYPFLHEIPEADRALLDLQVLVVPGQAEAALLQGLAATTGKNMVLYNTRYQPNGGHLCRYLKPAVLSETELRRITAAEKKLAPHQAIVAYENPLVFTDKAVQ